MYACTIVHVHCTDVPTYLLSLISHYIAYIDLLSEIWVKGPTISSAIAPMAFKQKVQRLAPMFQGYEYVYNLCNTSYVQSYTVYI